MRGNASIKIGRFLYIMRRTRKLKKAVGVAAVVAMTATMMPFGVMADSLGTIPVVAYAEEQTGESQSKVLTTIWNNVEVGTHEGNGSAVYSADTKSITVTGAGTMFGKDSGKDDCFYSYVNVKGNTTVIAKIAPDTANASGVVGIMAKNDASEDTSMAAGVYYDYDKKQIRAGRHGGASTLIKDVTTSVYVKLEFSEGKCYYTVAKDADFRNIIIERKGMGVDGLDPKTVGFFATSGNKADFSDVKITSEYTQDDNTINKVVFDSNVGELSMERLSSKDTSGSYGNFTYTESVDGNILTLKSSRDSSDKAEIRNDKSTNYLLFPETIEDMTISADITIKYLNNGTDKQGIAVGQFAVTAGKKVQMDIFQFNKNLAAQHNYTTTDGSTNGGSPKVSNLTIPTAVGENYATYAVTYSKQGDAAYVTMKSADGKELLSGDTGKIDLTASAESLGSGKSVRYGIAIGGATAEVANVTLYNADGEVVYDMNDYYIAVGVAPVINNGNAVIASDRNSINLNWDIATEGTGNVKYTIYVSKDGADYVKVGDSKVNSFSYTAMNGDGLYKFKIVPVGGDTQGTAIETEAVNYKTPLKQTVLKAEATDKNISLTWDAVDEATSYDIYKALGSDAKPELVKTTTDTAFNDKDVTAEEPYYYYVIAKNDNNTSNPSITLQVLASNGHTGTYVYENEAAKLTVISKDNDTVKTNKASVSMKSDKAGTAKLVVNGKEVTSKAVKADTEFLFEASLVQGRNDVDVLLTDEAGKTTRKVFNFVSNPKYDIVVDSAFAGTDGDVVDGYATYKTVQAAVNSISADNAESKVIFIKNGEYNERVTVEVPNVSLLGEDAEKTHIYYSAALADKTATDMWTRNAMYVGSDADGFTAENLTVENSFAYTNGSDQQADALCIVADKTACVNVRLVGYQDTLLTDSRVKGADGNYEVTRQYFSKCYITGNVDFIYGAGTSYFDDCDIVARYTEHKADGCFTAGRTYASTDYGYVFNNCRFTAEDKVADDSYRMARPWGKDDSTTFINCYLGRAIADTGYGDMSGNSYKNARFAEYGSYGPGYVLDNDRPLLSSTQVSAYTMNNVLGDYDASAVVKSLYKTDTPSTPDDSKPVNPTPDSPKPSDPTPDNPTSGSDVSIDTGKDAPSVEVKESVSDLIDNILSDDQKKDAEGKDVKIVLSVNKDIGVNEDDKKAAEKKLAELSSGKKAGMYLDIDLNVMIGNGNISVTETKKPIAIEVSVPDELINTDANKTRKYSVLRVHNGNVDVLDATYDENTKKILFKSDVFSTYVLVYEDTVKNPTPENPSQENPTTEAPSTDEPATETPAGTEIKDGDKSAQTGDKSPIAALVSLLGLSGLGIFASTKKKRV